MAVRKSTFVTPWRQPVPDFLQELVPHRFALLVVDMQYFCAHPEYGIIAELKASGQAAATEYYEERLRVIVPRLHRLEKAARAAGGHVIFTRIQGLKRDGSDRSYFHKYLGRLVPPGAKEGKILEELEPQQTDIVISKTAGGSFYATNLEYVLRNLGVTHLIIGGVVTEGCVETTMREAADRSFANILVEDACGSGDRSAHDAAVSAMGCRHCVVHTTAEAVARLASLRSAS